MSPIWYIVGLLALAAVFGLIAGLSGRSKRRTDWGHELEMTAIWAILLGDDD